MSLIEHEGVPLGVSICEDLWNDERLVGRRLYHQDPIGQLAAAGARVLVNISASPFWVGQARHSDSDSSATRPRKHGLPIVFVNQVGGNDELIFDGASMLIDAEGRVIAQAKAFEEDLLVVDTDAPSEARVEPYPESIASVHDALVLGLRDYVAKCGFKRVVLGLSGGIDSAVTAALAAAALGRTT